MIGNNGQGWANGSNFSPTGVPQRGDSVTIPSGMTVTVKGNIYGTLALLKIYIHGTMDFDPSGKLDLTVSSLIQIHEGGKIITNGSSSEIIAMGGVVKYNGHNDGTVNGPKYASGSTAFSTGTADDAGFNFGVLPVDLLSFTLKRKNNEVLLSWELNRDADIKQCVIQKRIAEAWNDIKKDQLNSRGTLPVNSFSYVDNAPAQGENLYRLKLVRTDGTTNYSKVLMLRIDVANGFKAVYPNPVKASAVFSFKQKINKGKISIITIAGTLVIEKGIPTGESQVEVDFSTLRKGFYYAIITDNNTVVEKTSIILSH